ncbi:Lrp/AsnC family transcriptional regulator [Amycolatopsis sp. H20-H5]|uniref:Lrp/AsnC family transcriptional regulator n=1 Tax=Amycolatopsis sp. H20-H5 TaxID=3046309 RepID=UPI002DBFAAFD|nr:Lrp/AsnC family transcriptional regulator [Amycolatopsis sp. H20-H5]MEC3982060.1 Lrp/AsnC family transcriptional regulator [Amycolatopsis sp. H20-H5]
MPHLPTPTPDSAPADAGSPDPAELTELDLALVEALQLDPRTPWTRIGTAVGIDATTAARRWDRLESSGLAWLTAYRTLPTQTVGYLDVDCAPGRLRELTAELCRWPAVFSLERTTGRHQLFLGAAATDLRALDTLVTHRLAELPGVTSLRLTVVTRVYREGSGWLVRALAPEQRAALDGTAAQARLVTPARWNDKELEALLDALCADGRRSCADLARDCGMSESAVRRVLARMLRNHELDFRCDLAHTLGGWPVIATYRLDVPGNRLDGVARTLATQPETRFCAAVTGEHNLLLMTWLRTPADCTDFEAHLTGLAPSARVTDRTVTLFMPKRMGRLLDADGRAVGQLTITPAA